MAKKILITGAAGLIGREVCKQLKDQGHTVIAIDNGSRFPGNYNTVDLLDYLKTNPLNDFDIIYHMAAINGTSSFYKVPNHVLYTNTMLDLAIFKFAETNPATKLIYASSSEIVAGTDQYPTKEESNVYINDIHNPRWSYRLPKILSENYLYNSNINFLIVRFFNVFSEFSGAGHFVKDITDKIRNNNFELIGADETRSFCYVEDAVTALIAIQDYSRDIVNIGSNEEIVIKDAANIIAESLGINNIDWKFIPSLQGSTKRRIPDTGRLTHYYPNFNPRPFKQIIDMIKDQL